MPVAPTPLRAWKHRIQRRNGYWLSGLLGRSTRSSTRAGGHLRDRVRPRTRRSRSGRGSREHQCLCDQVPSFVPCGDHINRAVQTGSPLEVDLASFGPGVTFGFELGLKFRFGLELGFGLEFGFGEGEIDHEAESVGQLPCR